MHVNLLMIWRLIFVKCGNKLSVVEDTADVTSAASAPQPNPMLESYNAEKEKAYFRSEGKVS